MLYLLALIATGHTFNTVMLRSITPKSMYFGHNGKQQRYEIASVTNEVKSDDFVPQQQFTVASCLV